jgi:hypothetical protein
MSGAERLRRYRTRIRNGRACHVLEFDTVRLEVMLREAGHLTAIEPTHADITGALQRLVEFLIVDCETRFSRSG